MAANITIPGDFGYIMLTTVAAVLVHQYMGFQVSKARRRYDVQYPTLYADEDKNKNAKAFNCIQRGHQNSLELISQFFSLLFLAGLKHPRVASALGWVYLLGRLFYFHGYASGDPKKRSRGMFAMLALLGLVCLNIYSAVTMLM